MPQSQAQRLAAVQEAISARLERRKLFPVHLFADPAWDILLALYAAALEDRTCGFDGLATVRLATQPLLLWIDALTTEGLVTASKTTPPTFRLTISGLSRMECFFSSPIDTSHC